VLGHSDAEPRRLETQGRVIDPITRRFVTEAGVAPGMRVLDVGSGTGDVALLLADVVGEHGEVVGFDRSAAALEVARTRASALSLGNVTFVDGVAGEVPVRRAVRRRGRPLCAAVPERPGEVVGGRGGAREAGRSDCVP
jgi:SAM-dependent methyltransferase